MGGSRLRSKRREALDGTPGKTAPRAGHCTVLHARAPVHWHGRQANEPPTPTDASKDQQVRTPSSKEGTTPESRSEGSGPGPTG